MPFTEMRYLQHLASLIQSPRVWWWHLNDIASKVSYIHFIFFSRSNQIFNRAVASASNTNQRTSKVVLLTKVHFSKIAEFPSHYTKETAPPQGFDAVGELHTPNGVTQLILQSAGGHC